MLLLTGIFYLVRLILIKLVKFDILPTWPLIFILFLWLSVHQVRPLLTETLFPLITTFLISLLLVISIHKEKISFVPFFFYAFSLLVLSILLIQSHYLVFLILIVGLPLIIFPKKILSFGLILLLLSISTRSDHQSLKLITSPNAETTNLILVIIDTARKDCIEIEGVHSKTPNIKALAEEGTHIQRFVANGAWTPPTHASIFTGLLPSEHGVFHFDTLFNFTPLSEKNITLAELLQENKINTASFIANYSIAGLFGFNQGFNQYKFIDALPPEFIPTITCADNNIKRISKYFPKYRVKYRNLAMSIRNYVALSDRVFQNASDWVKKEGTQQNFFLFLNLMEQHYIRYFHDPIDKKWQIGPKTYFEDQEQLYLYPETMTKKNTALLDWHKLTIRNVDYYLGRFIDTLKDQGLYDNTTIIVTSDHGNLFGEYSRYEHQDSLYAEDVFVPFIIKYADASAGRNIQPNRIYQQIDIFAEILDLFGVPVPPDIKGLPFPEPQKYPVFSQLYRMSKIPESVKNILDKDYCSTYLDIDGVFYQLIYATDGQHEMYRIRNFESTDTQNLYHEFSQHPEIASFIQKCPELMKKRKFKIQDIHDKEIIKKLKALGYIK
jgi:arylsulfatase A-like enzyme